MVSSSDDYVLVLVPLEALGHSAIAQFHAQRSCDNTWTYDLPRHLCFELSCALLAQKAHLSAWPTCLILKRIGK